MLRTRAYPRGSPLLIRVAQVDVALVVAEQVGDSHRLHGNGEALRLVGGSGLLSWPMWGTFVLDTYEWEQRRALREALEEIASPRDAYGFASGGIYCYWNVDTREILYIGKAVDLPDRFAAHNGLRGNRRGTKRDEISAHFAAHGRLGFTVLVRSSSSQTNVARLRHQVETDFGPLDDDEWELRGDGAPEAHDEISDAEGTGLRSHRLGSGRLPPWNQIEGRVNPWAAAMTRPDSTGDLITGAVDSLMQSRLTIAELADDPTGVQYEAVTLQLARSQAIAGAIRDNEQGSDYGVIKALDGLADPYSSADRERIRTDGYLLRRCPLIAEPTPPVAELRRAWTVGDPLPDWPPAPPLRD